MTAKIITKAKKKTAATRKPSPGQLTNAECAAISRLLDQVIAGKCSLAYAELRAEQIRARARRRKA